MNHIRLAVQKAGPTRTESFMGREYRVFPAVLVREQVLTNNLGRTFLPADEIQASVDQWNGIPVVLRHPTKRGVPVSARSPDVLNERGVGQLYRARFEESSLKADVFIDTLLAAAMQETVAIINSVDASEPTELSTGFLTNMEKTPGRFGGEEYDVVLRNIQPDHLALLPDEIGACSVSDGCGLGVNHQGPCESSTVTHDDPVEPATLWNRAVALLEKISEKFAGGTAAELQPVANAAGDQTSKGENMDRQKMIAQLVAAGPLDEAALNKLSDCQLKALSGTNAVNSKDDPEEVAILQERIQTLRREKEQLEAETATALQAEKRERQELIEELIFNGKTKFSDATIKAMPLPMLRDLHGTVFNGRNYSARGGPRAHNAGVSDLSFVRDVMGENSVFGKEN